MIIVYKSLSILIISLVYYVIVRYDYSVQITFHINNFFGLFHLDAIQSLKVLINRKYYKTFWGLVSLSCWMWASSFLGFWLWGSKLGCGLLASILLKVKALYIHIKYKQLVISDSNSIITEYNNFRLNLENAKAFW